MPRDWLGRTSPGYSNLVAKKSVQCYCKGGMYSRGLEIKCDVTPDKAGRIEFSSCTGIKLVKHAVKVVERVFEHKIRQQTTQMQEKFTVKGKKPYFVFVDLEKSFDRV